MLLYDRPVRTPQEVDEAALFLARDKGHLVLQDSDGSGTTAHSPARGRWQVASRELAWQVMGFDTGGGSAVFEDYPLPCNPVQAAGRGELLSPMPPAAVPSTPDDAIVGALAAADCGPGHCTRPPCDDDCNRAVDADCDGIPNGQDDDIDGDGIPNGDDPDVDGNGIPNGEDPDVDGDGIANGDDPDVDGDGIPNGDDADVDGDGIVNQNDPDVDGDGVPNDEDDDADGDGELNDEDDTPNGCTAGVNCPGACCHKVSGVCSEKTASTCTAATEVYAGDGKKCTPNPCCQIACDDGNPCTESACVNGVCVHPPLECGECEECDPVQSVFFGVCMRVCGCPSLPAEEWGDVVPESECNSRPDCPFLSPPAAPGCNPGGECRRFDYPFQVVDPGSTGTVTLGDWCCSHCLATCPGVPPPGTKTCNLESQECFVSTWSVEVDGSISSSSYWVVELALQVGVGFQWGHQLCLTGGCSVTIGPCEWARFAQQFEVVKNRKVEVHHQWRWHHKWTSQHNANCQCSVLNYVCPGIGISRVTGTRAVSGTCMTSAAGTCPPDPCTIGR